MFCFCKLSEIGSQRLNKNVMCQYNFLVDTDECSLLESFWYPVIHSAARFQSLLAVSGLSLDHVVSTASVRKPIYGAYLLM